MSFFCAKHISAGYGEKRVVRDVSLELENGCLMGILGTNGSGKTTLLKALCGILPHEGSCFLDGTELEPLSARRMAKLCSYIPQRSGISIDMSVLDVVLMGFHPYLRILEYPTVSMKQSAVDALKYVGLSGKEQDNYLHLSEGQKQLCILARTMVSDARLLLLDEPESALDFRCRYRMLDIIQKRILEMNGGAIVTLHDPVLALNYCDKLVLLWNGTVLDILSPQEEPLERMEQKLSQLYGSVSLHTVQKRNGKSLLTMIKEDNE